MNWLRLEAGYLNLDKALAVEWHDEKLVILTSWKTLEFAGQDAEMIVSRLEDMIGRCMTADPEQEDLSTGR